ncbi:hypothetical protein LQK91_21570 [Pantoea sp. MHSD4]|uniref:hypothetical protein n=1 Tax=Pantoea TaxID=53335 RepID=UPI001E49A780|nr:MULTISPECIES: hypothetical protein [Pantoea]MCD2358995.1 hypothetical protein [Pantoea sp. MHSD4]WEC75176.1 hypothetical protein LDO72_23305 [Pantoea agglomerans]
MSATDMNELNSNRINAEIAKLMAETQKLNAEAGKLTRETFWYPVAVSTGMIGAVATITVLIMKALGYQ